MKKKYDEDDSTYFDGEDKKPRLIVIIGGLLILLIIIFLLLSSCNKTNKKSTNNNLSNLRVTNGKIEPIFSQNTLNYNANIVEDFTTVVCSLESGKAKAVGCNERVEVPEGTTITHKIIITAENGSEKIYTLLIKRTKEVEELKHSVSVEGNVKSGVSTSGKVILEAIVDYENENYKYQWYKNDEEIENATSNKYVASESGNYTVVVTNTLSSYSVKSDIYNVIIKPKETTNNNTNNNINNNQSSSYTLKITGVNGIPTKWVTSATISVEVNASNGLANKAYSFDNGKTYSSSNTKNFTSNQTVKIVVKDSKGNKISKSITIDKIDNTSPKISITASNITNSSVKLTAVVTPTSTKSGYTYQWYKDNEKIFGATSSVYTAYSEGIYKVIVTTGTKKTATNSYTYSKSANELTCPVLTVSTESGNYIAAKTWTTENIYIKIEPSKYTTKYDIYLNETNNFSSISQKYSYFNTYTSPVQLKVSGKGQRVVKIVVKDDKGNSKNCYSKAYYLK